jgi:hypothetical protein
LALEKESKRAEAKIAGMEEGQQPILRLGQRVLHRNEGYRSVWRTLENYSFCLEGGSMRFIFQASASCKEKTPIFSSASKQLVTTDERLRSPTLFQLKHVVSNALPIRLMWCTWAYSIECYLPWFKVFIPWTVHLSWSPL